MASGRLIPKAPCASFILLTGSVVISRPSYPVACRSRGVSGIDSTAGEVLREASTSRHHPGRRSGHEPHGQVSPEVLLCLHACGQGVSALLGDLEDLLDAVACVVGRQEPLPHDLSGADEYEHVPPAIESWASAPEGPPPAALLVVSRPGGRHGQGVGWPGGAARLLAHAARGDIQP